MIRLQLVVDSLKEVELHDKALARAIRRALASARVRRYLVQRRVGGHEDAAIPSAEPFHGEALAALEAAIRKYAADLQKAAGGDERMALEAERQELADRAALNTHMASVKAEIARLQAIRFLETCITDTATNAITTLGNKIADQVLTPRLRDRFSAEIIELVGVNVRVEMVRAGGQYGSPQYQIRLLAKPDAKVADILSEGEQTCVAIAAFLAELATAPHSSALVFDDPITSLDHKWRQRVAERLVKELAVRQVIVFTHDLIFLNDIQEAAKHQPCQVRHIRRSSTTIGMVNAELPWSGMKIAARVDSLEKQARSLLHVRAHEDEETYKREARHFYDDLRAAWERALKEVAFAHVVMRTGIHQSPGPASRDRPLRAGLPVMERQLWQVLRTNGRARRIARAQPRNARTRGASAGRCCPERLGTRFAGEAEAHTDAQHPSTSRRGGGSGITRTPEFWSENVSAFWRESAYLDGHVRLRGAFRKGLRGQESLRQHAGHPRYRVIRARNPFGIARTKAPDIASQKAVCFSEVPLHLLGRLADKRSEYGIGFGKAFVLHHKGNPILYAYKDQPVTQAIHKLVTSAGKNAASPIWEVTPFIDAPGVYPNGSYFFEWEREWRKIGDLSFSVDDVPFLIIPEHLHKAAKFFFANAKRENLGPAYECPFIDAHWKREKIAQALRTELTQL